MESQNQPSMDGIGTYVKAVATTRRVRYSDFLLRVVGVALTLVAAVLVVLGKETEIVPIIITDSLPPLKLPVTARWQYASAFVYYVVSNAIACSYAALSLVLSMVAGGNKNGKAVLVLIILDLLIMGLLFSSTGAAAAVGVIGRYGNSRLNWGKVCNVFHHYCSHLVASLILSLLGSFVFFGLVLLAAFNLYNKSR
ncbi:hypothetical protein L1049_004156 [Liquidambar formosana]|uniref:CASP-like protein n=1 Tax=Liquidambar formosana TaxID=63359 RepID=A0AAP0X006_LIQFO